MWMRQNSYDRASIYENPKYPMSNSQAVHPGAILRAKFMDQYGLSASGLAIRLHVPAPRVNDIVRERRGISPDSALRLARFFRTTPQYWMDLQTAYDLRVAEQLAGEQIRREVAEVVQGSVQSAAPALAAAA
jgi:antitoxin HigA-1